MLTKFNDIKISLGRAIVTNVAILSIAFFAGVFYSNSTRHEAELKELDDKIVIVESRLDKKIGIINEQDKIINDLENRIIVLETKQRK